MKEEYEKLSKEIFPELKIAMLHGKMKPKEKEETASVSCDAFYEYRCYKPDR